MAKEYYQRGLSAEIKVVTPHEIGTPACNKMRKFEFSAHDYGRERYCEWGDFAANFWFTARFGRTARITAANALQSIKALDWPEGTTFEIVIYDEGVTHERNVEKIV